LIELLLACSIIDIIGTDILMIIQQSTSITICNSFIITLINVHLQLKI